MSDLIDRNMAITHVNAALFPKINTAKEAEKALRELPSIEERKEKWIQCSVGKPKKTGYYICTCHDGVCYRTSVLVWSTGWVLTGVRTDWRVIAWMPLPNPWKGEKDE